MEKDYITKIDEQAERRYFAPQIEARAEGDQTGIVEGIAAVVGKTTDMRWYEEEIAQGAFNDVMNDDVVALFNHDTNFPLARSNNGKGTLTLFLTPEGHLGYRYNTPDRQYARDLLDAIKSGDVTKSSFAFRIAEEEWIWGDEKEGTQDKRIIKKLERLYDVSPVTFPAYQDTAVAARSMEIEHGRQSPPNLINQRKQLFKRKYAK